MIGYSNPSSYFRIGDVVRIGNGRVEWTIVGKGATSGLTLRSASGRNRCASAHDVTLVRCADRNPEEKP